MRLGIIGAGHVGGTLGRLLESQGHDVRFGVRDESRAAAGGLPVLAPVVWPRRRCSATS